MPSKLPKKIIKKKSNIARRNRIKFPNEGIVSLNLARCTKDSLTCMIARLEIANKRHGTGADNKNINNTDPSKMPAILNYIKADNSPATSEIIKKMREKKILKGKEKKFKSIGRLFIKTFKHFSRLGEKNSPGNSISYHKTLRWLKIAEILDYHRVNIRDVEVHFINELKSGYELRILEFIWFLKSLCEDRGLQMCTVIPKLLSCRGKKAILKKGNLFHNTKSNEVRKLKPAHEKNFTPTDNVKKSMKEIPKSCKTDLEKQILGKNLGLVSEIQSSAKLSDEYMEYNASKSVPNSAFANLKSHTSFFNSKEVPSHVKTSAEWIVPALMSIPFENEDLVKVKKISGLNLLEEEPNKIPDFRQQNSQSKSIAIENRKENHDPVSVNLRTKDNGRQKTLQRMELIGVSLKNSYEEENYEFISEDDELIPSAISSEKINYREMSRNDLIHLDTSSNPIHSLSATVKSNSGIREFVETKEKYSRLKEQKNKVVETMSFADSSNLQFNLNKTKSNFTNKMEDIICIKNITSTMKTGDCFERNGNSSEILNNPKYKTINVNKRFNHTSLSNNKNSEAEEFSESKMANFTHSANTKTRTIRNCAVKTYKENVKNKVKEEYGRLETNNNSLLPVLRKISPLSPSLLNNLLEFENSSSRNQRNASTVHFRSLSSGRSPVIKNTSRQTNSSFNRDTNQRTFTNLPIHQVPKALSKFTKSKKLKATNLKRTSNSNTKIVKLNRKDTSNKKPVKLDNNIKRKKVKENTRKIGLTHDVENAFIDAQEQISSQI